MLVNGKGYACVLVLAVVVLPVQQLSIVAEYNCRSVTGSEYVSCVPAGELGQSYWLGYIYSERTANKQ